MLQQTSLPAGRQVDGRYGAAPGPVLRAILVLVGAAALLVPAMVVRLAPPAMPVERVVERPVRVIPKAELPPVEPIEFADLSPEDARAFNASVPFSKKPLLPARPFVLTGDGLDRARATDCLTAAMLYEAGDDPAGQRAVAQVVLNRVRHPAFPKSICGVVFQGSERATGCQFTFTCDGALARTYSDAAWNRARELAEKALNGAVDKRVGMSTHYHTDWVVPYWSASLDKVSAVHTHLFFRWTGWWGTPPAFRGRYAGAEPVIPEMARLSPAHRSGKDALLALRGTLAAALVETASLPKPVAGDPNSFLVPLDPRLAPSEYPALATRVCGTRAYCKFMAWTDSDRMPAALPADAAQIGAMSFSYLRDRARGFEKALWNCAEFERPSPAECMKTQLLPPPAEAVRTPPLSLPVPVPQAKAAARLQPQELGGVRRKGDPAGAAIPPVMPATKAAAPLAKPALPAESR